MDQSTLKDLAVVNFIYRDACITGLILGCKSFIAVLGKKSSTMSGVTLTIILCCGISEMASFKKAVMI